MVTLYDKIRGCIAGSWVGSSMGAAVEGWSHDRIVETYGWLDRLLPYKHYTSYTDWQRQPGTTTMSCGVRARLCPPTRNSPRPSTTVNTVPSVER